MVMKQDTPYRVRSVREQARELACVSEILEHATPAFHIYEAFGGIGILGKLLSERFPMALIDSYELDEECVGQYRERRLPNVRLHYGDTRMRFQRDSLVELPMDAASLDFNQFTLLDLVRRKGAFQQEILKQVLARHPKWIHLTDSARSHFHLNWRAYDLSREDWKCYVQQTDTRFQEVFGYKVEAHSNHSRAAYFLLVPVSP